MFVPVHNAYQTFAKGLQELLGTAKKGSRFGALEYAVVS